MVERATLLQLVLQLLLLRGGVVQFGAMMQLGKVVAAH